MAENIKKVKGKVRSMLLKFEVKVSKPFGKFILEIVTGVLITQSCNITEISRALKEDIKIKDTMKRLFNHLSGKTDLLKLSNEYLLEKISHIIKPSMIIALDDGDISHLFANKFENSCKVRDGSTGRILDGYYLNQITCYDMITNLTHPAYLGMYSTKSKDFKSANTEGLSSVEEFIKIAGKLGLWVMDRGYDNGIYLEYFLSERLNFIVRMKKSRDLIYKDKPINIYKLSKLINKRYSNGKHGKYGYLKCHIKIEDKLYPVTLVAHKGAFNQEGIIFLTNGHIKSSSEIKRRITGYFRRWSVEESYRFEKQGFGIEKSIVRNFKSIRSLLGAVMLAWSVLVDINEDEELKQEIIIASKPEKKKPPKFIYYTLLRGIRNIFAGIKTLFIHRKKKKQITWQLTIEDFLFPKSSLCNII